MRSLKKIVCRLVLLGVTLCFSSAFADVELKDLPTALDKVSLGMNTHVFYRADSAPYYGAALNDETTATKTGFGEIFSVVRLTAEKKFDWATVSGQFAPFYTQTIDQDVYGVAKDQGDLAMDQAWIKFDKIHQSPFSLTLGRQDIRLENWLIVADGEGQDQALWLNFHDSFPFALRVDGDFGKLQSTLYWARSDQYVQKLDETALFGPVEDIEIAGLNLHYDISEGNFVFAGLHRKIDDGDRRTDDNLYLGPGLVAQNDTLAWDLGAHLTIANIVAEIEGVVQSGDAGSLAGQDRNRQAYGGFTSLSYTVPTKYSPYLRGSYFYFSGDDDPSDNDATDYDPMFSGFGGWNRFVIGEVAGELHLPNSNKKVALAEIGFHPTETVSIAFMYLNQQLEEKYYLFIPTNSTKWADEVNVLIDMPLNENIFVHTGFGWSTPGAAAKEIFGDDEDNYFAQLWLSYSF